MSLLLSACLICLTTFPVCRPEDDCAYGVDIVAVKAALDTFNQLDEAVEQLIRRIGLPINIPQVADIWNQRDNFEKAFPNYFLEPSMFYVHPERGLFATLGVSNADTKDFGNSINHCDWFGGRLYEPHFTAFPAIQNMLKKGRVTKLALPILKVDDDLKFIQSERKANWLKNLPGFKMTDVTTDNETGIVVDLEPPYTLTLKKAEFPDPRTTLCLLSSSENDLRQQALSDEIAEAYPDTKMSSLLKHCLSSLTTILKGPRRYQCDIPSMGLTSVLADTVVDTKEWIEEINDLSYLHPHEFDDIIESTKTVTKGPYLLLQFIQHAEKLIDRKVRFLPRNDGDWSQFEFQFSEVEEQIILILAASILLIATGNIACCYCWRKTTIRARRQRVRARARANINNVPLVEQAALLLCFELTNPRYLLILLRLRYFYYQIR